MTGAGIEAGSVPAWHEEGVRAAGALDAASAVLVVGRDPEVSAWVALGMARAQAARRRVAVGDLVGEVGPLQALVADDADAHGITDSFLYGVSLNRIARPVDEAGTLFVLPSGSEPVASAEILTSDRWRRLAGGFREVGALLVLVAPADAEGLDALAGMMDGIVHAGDAAGLLPDAPPPLAVVAPTSTRRRPAVGSPATSTASANAAPDAHATSPAAHGAAPAATGFAAAYAAATGPARSGPDDAAPTTPTRDAGTSRRSTPAGSPDGSASTPMGDRTRWWLAGGLLAVVAGAAFLLLSPSTARRGGVATTTVLADSVRSAGSGLNGASPNVAPPNAASPNAASPDGGRSDSARSARVRADSLRAAGARSVTDSARGAMVAAESASAVTPGVSPMRPGETLPRLAVTNPADSAQALAYAVYVQSSNTPDGALLDDRTMAALPLSALTPVLERGAPWYRLLVGGFGTRAEAERLLGDLRARKVLGSGSGSIVRAPYALRLADRVPASAAPRRIAEFARLGIGAYLLSNGDGTVNVYAGAFETPSQAAFLARNLQTGGAQPVLVYRTGRSL